MIPFKTLIAICRLLRLSNSLSATTLLLVGAYLTIGWPLPIQAWQAAIAMWCVTAYGYVSNDYTDLAEDRINKPDRPLPAGIIQPSTARYLTHLLAIGAIGWSLAIALSAAVVAALVLALLTLYNYRLKSSAGWGNLVIALLTGCTLLAGSIAVQGLNLPALWSLLPPALILVLFILTREILKTIEDIAGDTLAGQQTVAVRWGYRRASQTVVTLASLTLVLIGWAYRTQDYSMISLAIMLLGVGGPLLYTIKNLWQENEHSQISRCLALLKGSYFAGILALLLP